MCKSCCHTAAYLRVVSHDVIKACQQAQAGTDLYVHGPVHVVEEVQSLVDQLAALLQKTWKWKKKKGKEKDVQVCTFLCDSVF